MSESDPLYVLRVTATAGPSSGMKLGDRHASIVMVQKATEEEARRATIDVLKQRSWHSPEILEVALVNPTLNLPSTVESALRDARVHGFSIIVFSDPLPKN